jgi:glutathione-regulated potassium-efflux system ancillary protein KefG
MDNLKRIAVFFFHPRFEDSRVNKRLIAAITGLPGIALRDMYELYPDFNIDVKAEQQALIDCDVAVIQHPFFWYSAPPLAKQWLDLVLEYGWAYGKGGDKLRGKWALTALSSGGTFDVYREGGRNRFTYRELLSPFDQSFYLCGMHYLPPFIVPGASKISEADLEAHARKYVEVLKLLQRPELGLETLTRFEYFNQIDTASWPVTSYKTH